MTKPFICDNISRSCGAGSVESVREMASGQVIFGGSSAPGGRGGSALDCGADIVSACPFIDGSGAAGALFAGALSPAPLSFDQSTLSFLPMIS